MSILRSLLRSNSAAPNPCHGLVLFWPLASSEEFRTFAMVKVRKGFLLLAIERLDNGNRRAIERTLFMENT